MITFLLYSSLFLLLAYFESRHLRNNEDYFVAGRQAGGIQTGFSVIASCVGASATIGVCGLAFSVGLPAMWWLLSGAIGLGVLTVFLLKRLRHRPHLTMLEIVRERLGTKATKLCAGIIVLAWISILAAQFSAMASIVEQMTDLPATYALLLGSMVILLYTLLGGQAAVMKSDVIQLLVMVGGLSLLLIVLFDQNPQPFNNVQFELLNDDFDFDDWTRFMVLIGGSYVVCPMLFSRFMSSRSHQSAAHGAIIAIIGLIAFSLLIVLIGIEARNFIPANTPSDQVLAAVTQQLSDGTGVIITLVLISAILSSADSCLITAATVVSNDLMNRPSIRLSRLIMVVLAMLGIFLASSGKAILELLLMANNIYVCSVVAPVFVAICTTKPLHRPTIICSLLISAAIALASEWLQMPSLSYWALLISILGSILSYLRSQKAMPNLISMNPVDTTSER